MSATSMRGVSPFQVVSKEVQIAAPIECVFDALLEELGPGGQLPDGKPQPMVIEPWIWGRWYPKFGSDCRAWGRVEIVEPPRLLRIRGPMFLSERTIGFVEYRLTAVDGGTRLVHTFGAIAGRKEYRR